MERRTKIDFSRHKVEVIKTDEVLIHKFKRPDTNNCCLTFINTCGVLTVTGDFGNWVFCREFHPSAENETGVSAGYWDEKLEIASKQKAKSYSSENTLVMINEFEKSFQDAYGREMAEEEKDWIESLKNNVDDETEYTYLAYREKPNEIDYESVPYGVCRHFWLNAVYDGFDEICQALHREMVAA